MAVDAFDPNITSPDKAGISEKGKRYLLGHQKEKKASLPTFEQLVQKAEKLLSNDQKAIDRPYPMAFEASRELFWLIYKRKVSNDLVLDGNLKVSIRDLILYFTGSDTCPYSLKKGIYLFGNVGIGKTALMEAFSVFTQTLNYKYFQLGNVRDISFRIQRQKETALLDNYMNGNWCIDDLFADQEQSKIYGNSTDVSKILIEQFYLHGWRQGKKIHITSNIEPEDIGRQIPDPRFIDRVKEMMTPVELIGKSKRL